MLRQEVIFALAPLLCGSSEEPAVPVEESLRPNIIIVLIDDMGDRFKHTGTSTPSIDRLAEQGMRFTNAYAAAPNCSPTRAAILTGKSPARLHLTKALPSPQQPYIPPDVPLRGAGFVEKLDPSETTLAEALKKAGYATAHIGKWHLGDGDALPHRQGFDVNIGGSKRAAPRSMFSPYRLPYLQDGESGEFLTDRLTDEAIRFIDENRERPFFLHLAHYALHRPLAAKETTLARLQRESTANPRHDSLPAAALADLDESLGRLVDKLDQLELSHRTVLVLTSDNGSVRWNGRLRGSKNSIYEGGLRVPMIVRWPDVVEAGSTCSEAVTSCDLYPTALAIAGLEAEPERALDGESLLPLLAQTGRLERKAIYWHYPHYTIGKKGWRRQSPTGAVLVGSYKLHEFYEDGTVELYDLANDPGERNNLAESLPEQAEQLSILLASWRKSVGALMPTPNPAYDPALDVESAPAENEQKGRRKSVPKTGDKEHP